MEKAGKNRKNVVVLVIALVLIIAIIAIFYVRAKIEARQSEAKENEEQIQELQFKIDFQQGALVGQITEEVTIQYYGRQVSEEQYQEYKALESEVFSDRCSVEKINELYNLGIKLTTGDEGLFKELINIETETYDTFKKGYTMTLLQFATYIGYISGDISEEKYNMVSEKYEDMIENPTQEKIDDYLSSFDKSDFSGADRVSSFTATHPFYKINMQFIKYKTKLIKIYCFFLKIIIKLKRNK